MCFPNTKCQQTCLCECVRTLLTVQIKALAQQQQHSSVRWCVHPLPAPHMYTPWCVSVSVIIVWIELWVGVVYWPVRWKLCLGRCGMLRGLTEAPQPVLASQPASQAEWGRTQLPPLSCSVYWFTLWDFSSLASVNTHQHTNTQPHGHSCKWTHVHFLTCMHSCNT